MAATSKILGWLLTVGVMAISIAVNGGVAFVAYGPVLAGFMCLFTAVLDGVRVILAQQFARHKIIGGALYAVAMAIAWGLFHFSYVFAVEAQSKPDAATAKIKGEIETVEKLVVPGRRTPEAIKASSYCVKYPDKNNCSGVVYSNKEKKERLAELDAELGRAEESIRNESKLNALRSDLKTAQKNALERSEHLFALNVPALQSALTFLPFIISAVVELGIIAGAWALMSHAPKPPRALQSAPWAIRRNAPEHYIRPLAEAEFAEWLHASWLSKRGADGWAWYTQRTMAAEAGVSGSGRVNTLLQIMEADGRIEKRTSPGRGKGTAIRFRAKLSVVR